MFKAFLLIHSLVLGNNSDKLTAEEEESVEAELQKADEDSLNMRATQMLLGNSQSSQKNLFKKHITPRQFRYIYRKNIKDNLQVEGKLFLSEFSHLLVAYEQYRFEKNSK